MNKINEIKLEVEQTVNLKYYKAFIIIDGKEDELDLTVSQISKSGFDPEEAPDNIVVSHRSKKLGVISEGEIYVAIDSNGDGKIDINDFSWKALNLLKEEFKIESRKSKTEDPYIKGIKVPKEA